MIWKRVIMYLTSADFPLYVVGANVYRVSGAILLTAPSDQIATELVIRLNRDHMQPSLSGYRSLGELVYG
jgi:hypothetical protein